MIYNWPMIACLAAAIVVIVFWLADIIEEEEELKIAAHLDSIYNEKDCIPADQKQLKRIENLIEGVKP